MLREFFCSSGHQIGSIDQSDQRSEHASSTGLYQSNSGSTTSQQSIIGPKAISFYNQPKSAPAEEQYENSPSSTLGISRGDRKQPGETNGGRTATSGDFSRNLQFMTHRSHEPNIEKVNNLDFTPLSTTLVELPGQKKLNSTNKLHHILESSTEHVNFDLNTYKKFVFGENEQRIKPILLKSTTLAGRPSQPLLEVQRAESPLVKAPKKVTFSAKVLVFKYRKTSGVFSIPEVPTR